MACSRAQVQDDFRNWIDSFEGLHIDIGTGDGAYVLRMAREHPMTGVIGIDTCLDNLVRATRRPPRNLRFIAADGRDVPAWLRGTATSVSINFPYGSLLHAVAGEDEQVLENLLAVARSGARIDIRVNASAGADYGMPVEVIHARLARAIRWLAPGTASITILPHDRMRSFPSTWAKRLAYGRPSQVIVASAMIGV